MAFIENLTILSSFLRTYRLLDMARITRIHFVLACCNFVLEVGHSNIFSTQLFSKICFIFRSSKLTKPPSGQPYVALHIRLLLENGLNAIRRSKK